MSMIPRKRCSHCQQYKSATKEFFTSNKSTKDGLHNMCKICTRDAAVKRAEQSHLPPKGTMKFCPKCQHHKPATLQFFNSHRRSNDHLYYICKECKQTLRRKPSKYIVQEGYKHCYQCHENKPATMQFFPARKTSKDGLYAWCKDCVKRKHKEQKSRIDPSMTHRECSKCGKVYQFTIEHFHKSPYGINGLTAKCKYCVSEESRNYRAKNHDRVLRNTQEWRKRNQEYIISYSRRYYAIHREKCRQRWITYHTEHRDQIRERRRRHYFDHRDQMIKIMRERKKTHHYYSNSQEYSREHYRKNREYYIAKAHRRQAMIKGIPGNYTVQDVRDQYKRQKGRCYYCHCKVIKENFHLDHTFPVSRDFARNSIDHIVITCARCNLQKSNKYPWEWIEGGRLL